MKCCREKNANNSISNTCFDEFSWESKNTSEKCIQMCIQSHQPITKWYFPENPPQPAMSLHPALRWCAHSWAPRLAVGTAVDPSPTTDEANTLNGWSLEVGMRWNLVASGDFHESRPKNFRANEGKDFLQEKSRHAAFTWRRLPFTEW